MSATAPEPAMPRPLGHEKAMAELFAAMTAGRCHHALMLTGPAGIGKSLSARLLGMTFLCSERTRTGPCGECRSCRRFLAGGHPDWHQLEPPAESSGLTIPVAEVRKLETRLRLTPAAGVGRVVFIKEARKLQDVGQNTLLKTLEEPPPNTLFLLVVLRPTDLLPTVVSRCQIIRLQPLSPAQVEQIVAAAGEWDPADQARAIAMADGSPGKAIGFLDQDGRQLLEAATAILDGGDDHFDPVGKATQILATTAAETRGKGTVTSARRRRATFFISALRHETARRGRILLLEQGNKQTYYREFTRKVIELCTQAEKDITMNLDPILVLEVLLINLAKTSNSQ